MIWILDAIDISKTRKALNENETNKGSTHFFYFDYLKTINKQEIKLYI